MSSHRIVSICATGLLVAGVLWGLGACDSGRISPSGEPMPAPSAADSAQPRRTAAPHDSGSARAPSAEISALKLEGGGILRLPAGAKLVRTPERMPGVVKQAKTFSLPGGRQRLMVSELDLEGQTCEARLEGEWKRMQANKRDRDAERLKVRRVTSIEDRTVAGRRVLYSESMQGTTLADAGKPFAAVVSAMSCARHSLLLLMHVSQEPRPAASVRPMLDAVVSSYR